jgi:DNA (cytosine-5)-methyltransferase 1
VADTAINVLSLCSGIGGIELGLRLALGQRCRTVGYVERDPYAARTLLARMEDAALEPAPVWCGDLREFDGRPWRGAVDIITGGYPCQPFSVAGKRLGERDPRHLWPEIRRIVMEVQPGLCFFENVGAHLTNGFDVVRGDLRELGYRVENDRGEPTFGLFTAREVGFPHKRERLFVLAYRMREREREQDAQECSKLREDAREDVECRGCDLAYTGEQRREGGQRTGASGGGEWAETPGSIAEFCGALLGDADGERRREAERGESRGCGPYPPGPNDGDAWGGCSNGTRGSRRRYTIKKEISEQRLKRFLNPRFVEWLMGFPLGWTNGRSSLGTTSAGASEMEWCRWLRVMHSCVFLPALEREVGLCS